MTESKPIVSEFLSSKIVNRKLDGNNYLQGRKIIEINLISRGKKSHLYEDPPSSTKNEWE